VREKGVCVDGKRRGERRPFAEVCWGEGKDRRGRGRERKCCWSESRFGAAERVLNNRPLPLTAHGTGSHHGRKASDRERKRRRKRIRLCHAPETIDVKEIRCSSSSGEWFVGCLGRESRAPAQGSGQTTDGKGARKEIQKSRQRSDGYASRNIPQ